MAALARYAKATAAVLLCSAVPVTLAAQTNRTTVELRNATAEVQTVGVVLAALGASGRPCDASHPPITAEQLAELGFCSDVINSETEAPYAGKCTLTLDPGATVAFPDIANTCISGNVTFGGFASCPSDAFPQGTTTAEFTLNTSTGADEVIDVSLVNGYSSKTTMSTSGAGGGWVDQSGAPITEIVPQPLGRNVGNPGVYPQNCTDCIQLVGPPVCPGFGRDPVCQQERICNVRRPGADSGGTVTITLQPKAGGLGAPGPSVPGPIGPLAACAGLPTAAAADFFANVRDLQAPEGAVVGDPVCPSFCFRAKRACAQVAQLARHCLDSERAFHRIVARAACQADVDPSSCRDDLRRAGAQDRENTTADLAAARAFCQSEALDDCLARCGAS